MDLFGKEELSRSDKMRRSRKVTTDLTREVIDWLNNSQQFQVNRSNNFPSPRITGLKQSFYILTATDISKNLNMIKLIFTSKKETSKKLFLIYQALYCLTMAMIFGRENILNLK